MLAVGLTGGIGSGKTAVSDRFAALGVPVIDTDVLARELVEPGEPALAEIRGAFGDGVIGDDGALDRSALGRVVFADPAARQRLEGILHPRIRAAVRERLAALDAPYAIVVIPLLFETGQADLVDRVLVVDVPVAVQRERVRRRDGFDEARIDQVLAAQVDRETRLAGADEVIRNDGPLEALNAEVRRLDALYRTRSLPPRIG